LKKLSLFLTFEKVVVVGNSGGKRRKNLKKFKKKDIFKIWSGRQDLNLQPFAPHATALPGCATPRHNLKNIRKQAEFALSKDQVDPKTHPE
jgi:hypothetical protein